jgi:hypothetical protein
MGQEGQNDQNDRSSSLQMHSDPAHERREWFLQRLTWLLMLLIAIAALAGVLGDGPASNSHAGNIGADLYAEYDRYLRHQSPLDLKVYCRPGLNKEFAISFDRSFLEQFEIQEIQPGPTSTALAGDKWLFKFNSSTDQQQLVLWRLAAKAVGKVENQISLDGKTSIQTGHFIFP